VKKPCSICGKELKVTPSSRSEPVCHGCRRSMTRAEKIARGIIAPQKQYPDKDYSYKKAPCDNCGGLAWKPNSRTGTASDGRLLCRACHFTVRTVVPRERKVRELACAWCLSIFTPSGKTVHHCSQSCAQRNIAAKRSRSRTQGSGTRRSDRERVAPGLRYAARKRLLAKWKRQGRACTFCPMPASTIDHAIPLARGGTNYEGNLIPCCKACNSSKSDLLSTEWRYSRPHGGTVGYAPWLADALKRQPVVKAEQKPKPERYCYICGGSFSVYGDNRRTCGGECSIEYAKRASREVYRARVNLPPTWHLPTKPHAQAA